MNQRERKAINSILDMANSLMDAGPNDKAQITNADVVEAILGDLIKFLNNSAPDELTKLIERDKEGR